VTRFSADAGYGARFVDGAQVEALLGRREMLPYTPLLLVGWDSSTSLGIYLKIPTNGLFK